MSKPRKRKKSYNPNNKHNPITLGKQLSKLREEIDKITQQKDLVYSSMEKHVEYLTNFTSHDIKNALQNMDSVVSTIEIEEFSEEDSAVLKTCLNSIRQSLDNFATLVPNSTKREFKLIELAKASELINRSDFNKHRITMKVELDKTNHSIINQPFHSILQVLNNLILNAIKALEDNKENPTIFVRFLVKSNFIEILVCDNGCGISQDIRNKIFDMYFTTSGGSGIGLYHARYTLEQLNGSIDLDNSFDYFNTTFKIEIPLKDDKININN